MHWEGVVVGEYSASVQLIFYTQYTQCTQCSQCIQCTVITLVVPQCLQSMPLSRPPYIHSLWPPLSMCMCLYMCVYSCTTVIDYTLVPLAAFTVTGNCHYTQCHSQ